MCISLFYVVYVSINLENLQFLSSEEEIANKKNPLLQHDEMCWVVASTIFYQMSRLLYVTFSFANITIVRYGISSSFLQCLPRFYDPVLT